MESESYTIISDSPEMTESIGETLGRSLRGGECLELLSDMGGGKTTFMRGLARGVGSLDTVSSPTFTIAKQYIGANCTIYHYDFYRLNEAGHVVEELREGLDDPHGVTVVEWGDSVQDALPDQRIKITFEKRANEPENRLMYIEIPTAYVHMKGLRL